jgi:tetratricopeptide (TPR) repeat protein
VTPSPLTPPKSEAAAVRLAGIAIVLAVAAAYANSLSAPFVFDDGFAIVRNPTIRQLWRIGEVLSPPSGFAVCARPLVNLSLAVNYAVSGLDPWSYHALNVVFHALSTLALFGILRRTLALKGERRRAEGGNPESDVGKSPTLFAFTAALLWALHPLLTESVTFVIQRTESLMGLFYLLTIYCFIRSVDLENDEGWGTLSPSALRLSPFWSGLCFLSCLFGMASKEVMVSAPLLVLLYDRTFVAGTFAAAWGRRRPLYLALASTWILLAWLVLASGGNRAGAAGFGTGIAWWVYGLTQGEAIVHYLRLALWPAGLTVDYGERLVGGFREAAPQAVAVFALLGATLVALRRRPALGFLGAWFFAILAPSSSILPLATQTVAEHRMYLPLASLAVLFALGLRSAGGGRGLAAGAILAAGLGGLTARRNHDYRTEAALWTDTVGKQPANPRAHYNLGVALDRDRAVPDAILHYREAIRLKPDYVEAHNNLANDLQLTGRLPEALAEIQVAVRLKPDDAEALYNLGNALFASGRPAAAADSYGAALRIRPDYAEAHTNLGVALFALGRTGDAIASYQAAARLDPGYAVAQYDWGNALAETGRAAEAIAHYEQALRLDPRHAGAQANLGNALLTLGQLPGAIAHYRASLALNPANARTRVNLGNALAQAGDPAAAAREYQAALRLQPDFPGAREALARLPVSAPDLASP